ncbi:MAG TPA: major capsid family protein [Pseudolysinimonas sp.]|jgi:hypothetical protein
MATISPSWTQVHPSFIEPEVLLPYNQASGAFETLAGADPRVKISSEDLYVYAKRFDVRTRVASGQNAYNQLPSVNVAMSMMSVPTYLNRVRAEYDHHDTAATAEWGASIVEVQRLGMRQGHFQLLRNMLLYGMLPANGEGLINAAGAVTVSLPADSGGNTTFSTYDNGQLAIFFLTQISNLKTRTFQFGMPNRFVILGPQRILGGMATQNIVQLTAFQRPGSGTATTAGVLQMVEAENGDQIVLAYDDTLIGKGSGGTDMIIMVMPEVKKPVGRPFNTNEFANIATGLDACTLQYLDMASPREIPTPLAGGAIDVLSEWRATPGWVLRPEAITLISMGF